MSEIKGYIVTADEKGSINISEDVVAIIAAAAAAEVEGVYEPFIAPGKETTNMLGRRGAPKGVKLCIDGDDIIIDINVITRMGYSVSEIGTEVQKAVMSAVEDATGVAVTAVNVNICGIALDKE